MKKKLRTSLLGMTLLLVVLLACVQAVSAIFMYCTGMIGRYQQYAGDTVAFIARQVDGDDLETCIKTGKKSKKYEELQQLVNDLKESHDLEYIYIVKPLKAEPPHNMMDVLAASTAWERENEGDTLTDLGVITEYAYPADAAEQYLARMDHDPTITYFRNDSSFGAEYTAIRPIFNSAGEPIAVLCADVRVNDINASALSYTIAVCCIVLTFSIVALFLVDDWIGNRVVRPIRKLQVAAGEFEDKCRRRAEVSELVMDDPNPGTGDEIEALSASIVSMVRDVREYAQDLTEKENEIMSLKEYVSKMDALAYRDVLTGAGNKAAYEKAVSKLNRDILLGNADFAIVMLDLNYLKRINDRYGHDKGNEYIRGLYGLIRESFGESPVFRIGGDEFVVLAQDEELVRCSALIARMRQRIREAMWTRGLVPWERVSAAIGCAKYTAGDDVDAVFRRADAAMYAEKKRMHAQR